MIEHWLSQEPPAIVVPVPTVVVKPQVTIPPEVLERLVPPDPGFLTQPVATLIAGSLALFAAIIAFGGVLYAQYRQKKQLDDQLRVQQTLHDDAQERQAKQHAETLKGQLELLRLQTHATEQQQRRQERISQLQQTQATLSRCHSAAGWYRAAVAEGKVRQTVIDEFAASFNEAEQVYQRLTFVDLDDLATECRRFVQYCGRVHKSPDDYDTTVAADMYHAAMQRIRLTVQMEP